MGLLVAAIPSVFTWVCYLQLLLLSMSLLTLSTCYFSCLTFILLCWNSSVYVNAKISISALPPPSNDTVEVEIYSYIYFIGQIGETYLPSRPFQSFTLFNDPNFCSITLC